MIVDVGDIIISKINTLPFIDKVAGVVRVASFKDGKTTKKYPISCRTSFDDCLKGKRYFDLCPDSSKKSVLYLEGLPLRQTKKEGNYIYFTAQYNLICWLNLPKLGFTGCSYSASAIQALYKKLSINRFNSANYHYVDINILGQQPKDVDPFSKYSYDETVNQYLLYPYDFFVLTINVDFQFDSRCLKIESLNPAIDCVTK